MEDDWTPPKYNLKVRTVQNEYDDLDYHLQDLKSDVETEHPLWPRTFVLEYGCHSLWNINQFFLFICCLVDLLDCLPELTKAGLGGTLLDGLLRDCAVYHICSRVTGRAVEQNPYLLHGRFISLCFRFIQTRTQKKPSWALWYIASTTKKAVNGRGSCGN